MERRGLVRDAVTYRGDDESQGCLLSSRWWRCSTAPIGLPVTVWQLALEDTTKIWWRRAPLSANTPIQYLIQGGKSTHV
jgi:hypothetical protein